jgi:3-hydroxyacyl-[acyl-carrier-protein] dehydratase
MTTLDLEQIKSYLPHRYPFLFVDRVEEIVPGESIRARKCVTGNEAFFNGHFPNNPVMPGVIQIEAMGQAGALLAILSGADVGDGRAIYVTSISECKFRKVVVPGDVLELRARVVRQRLGMWKLQCEVWVDGALASEALVTATAAPAATQKEVPPGFPAPKYGRS